MKVFIKILIVLAGIFLGLALSFITIVCLDAVLSDGNPFDKNTLNLWAVATIIAGWLFLILWPILHKSNAKKINTQGLEHLPQSISDLIDGIIDAMQYRKSVRAEVRQELADHFTDAMAGCEDVKQQQECIQELIEGFGDVELLGKLLRRAKKRCRPLWRTVAARTFQLIGICFLLLILYIGWFFTGKPAITVNYVEKMNQMVRPVADESQNAWPLYKEAAEKRIEYKAKAFDFHPTNPSPFTRSEQDKQVIQQSIKDNQESLELIRQGNQKPYYWRVYEAGENHENEMMAVLMPPLGYHRNLARLMCWRGLLNAEQSDFEKAFNEILESYLFGQHLRGQNTTLIEQLVSMSIEWMSMDALRMVLAEYDEQIDTESIDSLRKRFSPMISDKDFSVDFASEVLFMRDEAQRCFTRPRFGRSHLYLPRLKELGALEVSRLDVSDGDELAVWLKGGLQVLFAHPDKEQTLKHVEQFYSKMEKMSAMTPATARSQNLDIDKYAEEIMKENILLGVLMPALTKLIDYSHQSRVDSEATLAILAILQHEKQYGQYPESLDVLVEKNLLKEVPIDPFSDKLLVYKKTDDDFTVYSIGHNLIDDGGVSGKYEGTNKNLSARRWMDHGDAIFWPVNTVSSQQ